ncbi:MAG TPA: hypothetical protein VMV69_08755 [Pirellulales bacterium]|nr:hypothetical protein [Pirellulales bacterium]
MVFETTQANSDHKPDEWEPDACEYPEPDGLTEHDDLPHDTEPQKRPRAAGAPSIRNWELVEVEDKAAKTDKGRKCDRKQIYVPMPVNLAIDTIRTATGNWPRRVSDVLFVPAERSISWLEKPASLFGWAGAMSGIVSWRTGIGYVTKQEAFCELQRTAKVYHGVEVLPHWPTVDGHYYATPTPACGSGSTLGALLDRFCPATQIDRDLLLAATVTPGWGGPPGARPAFLLTSDLGRGTGKSKTCAMISRLWGGALDFNHREDLGTIKQRLLSPEGLTKRVALLDNLKTLKFSWAELEALITATDISGKRMFVGEGSRPNLLTWFITLNGASLAKDMAQRVVIIKVNRPAYSADWEEGTIEFIEKHRDALLADVAAFYAGQASTLERHSRWGAWERAILSRLAEPAEAQQVILERQTQVDVEEEESVIIEDFFSEQLARLNYDPSVDVVHIPTKFAALWLGWATNEKDSVTAATQHLKQLATEGQLKRLAVDPSRTHGRGFKWTGEKAAVGAATLGDFEARNAARGSGQTGGAMADHDVKW